MESLWEKLEELKLLNPEVKGVQTEESIVVEVNSIPKRYAHDPLIVQMKAKAKELGLLPPYPLSPEDWLGYFETMS